MQSVFIVCGGRPVKKINMPSAKWENGKPGLALCNPHKIYLLFVKARLEINLLDSLQQAYIALDKPKNIKLPHSKKVPPHT